ncbi:antibiotic biosynthesis monooxygenase [Pokkaliibacter plantistimulans]|uniref:Antibiotic biosynthesis monooxygenase n=1 Tax=Proteobacteria bacterium 228 TaxID=2083153 RepID=A0A2S5KMH3_9PROT|nr:antibiotic biosynthesis monooxygenase [Pokkaliibacter plantistimulans]PPC76011.1 antibiotic biosynthesis monooxygenase [Pokkaliibacter plantistimulans]
MLAVLFEVTVATPHRQRYLDLAALLRPQLDTIPGFISIKRFQSLTDSNRVLSLSWWENEHAISQWRQFEAHRMAQSEGKAQLFDGYRIHICEVVRQHEFQRSTRSEPAS